MSWQRGEIVSLVQMRLLFPPVFASLAALCAASVASFVLGPAAAASPRTAQQAVVYDTDDRQEVSESTSSVWQGLSARAVVALVPEDRLERDDGGAWQYAADTVAGEFDVCPDERFAGQPSAAFCTGTLISRDLVLTAGHCVDDLRECQRFRYVFGYALDASGALPAPADDAVYSCAALIAAEERPASRLTLDYAVLRLDRPVAERFGPAEVRTSDEPLDEGTEVTLVGFPSGMPAKVAGGAAITDARTRARDYFRVSTDSFSGNSGGAVFSNAGRVLGVLVRGLDDYVDDGSCKRVQFLETTQAAEEVTAMPWILRATCEALDERGEPLPDFCDPIPCARNECALDDPDVPREWFCPAVLYGDGVGCDCDCGAQDPDCLLGSAVTYNCEDGVSCNARGTCGPLPDSSDAGFADAGADAGSDAGEEGGQGGCAITPPPQASALWLCGLILAVRRRRLGGAAPEPPAGT